MVADKLTKFHSFYILKLTMVINRLCNIVDSS